MTLERYFDDDRTDLRRRERSKKSTRVWKVSEMWDVHHRIAEMVALGMKNVDIARKLNVTPQTISNVKNSPKVQKYKDIVSGAMAADNVDLGIRIQKIAPKALDFLENLIKGQEEDASLPLRAKAAESMMDRAGYGAVRKLAAVNTHLTAEDIEGIKDRARTSGIIKAVVDEAIDVTDSAN